MAFEIRVDHACIAIEALKGFEIECKRKLRTKVAEKKGGSHETHGILSDKSMLACLLQCLEECGFVKDRKEFLRSLETPIGKIREKSEPNPILRDMRDCAPLLAVFGRSYLSPLNDSKDLQPLPSVLAANFYKDHEGTLLEFTREICELQKLRNLLAHGEALIPKRKKTGAAEGTLRRCAQVTWPIASLAFAGRAG